MVTFLEQNGETFPVPTDTREDAGLWSSAGDTLK